MENKSSRAPIDRVVMPMTEPQSLIPIGVERNASKLYVVGNGFDLWHGIASSYGGFRSFVKARDRKLFQTIEDYLPAGDDWADLEGALASIDIDSIVDDLCHFMASYGSDDWSDAGHHDFQYEVDGVVERLSVGLRKWFADWIRQLEIPSGATAKNRLRTLDAEGVFLTFNYPPALREIYGVPDANVLHIHGQAAMKDEDLVLGHAWDPTTRPSLNDRPDIEDIDTRMAEANDILDRYFSATFKPSERLVQDNQQFFDALNGIKEVGVLGHSLSEVDARYFVALLNTQSVSTAKWTVACRFDSDRTKMREKLKSLGVQTSCIVTALWGEL